ncbi:hypothetical protein ACWEPC_46800 [Nonomuraea sp. NPDC004297]
MREVLLPMLLWPSVPVVRRIEEALTIVDRFVLEAALTLAPVRATDVEEITGIPADAVVRVAGRLAGLNLIVGDGLDYHANGDQAREALRSLSVPEYKTAYVTFLYLPQGDDLIAFSRAAGGREPPLLQRVAPVSAAPLPDELAGAVRAEVLDTRIAEGRVSNLPDDVVGAVALDQPIEEFAHAYRCRGHVKGDTADPLLVLEAVGGASGRTVQCVIPGAIGTAERWAAITAQAAVAGNGWCDGGGTVEVLAPGPGRPWRYTLDARAAEAAMREKVPLEREAELLIREEDCELGVRATFEPADREAAVVFARQQVCRSIARVPPHKMGRLPVHDAVLSATAAYGLPNGLLTEENVREDLWAQGFYRHIYALRAPEDFPDD